MIGKKYIYNGFGETLEFAETLGWLDIHPGIVSEWVNGVEITSGREMFPGEVDDCEENAIDFIESKGFEIHYPE